jgi:hypothetical protein
VANAHRLNFQQKPKFFNLSGNVAHPDGAMKRRTMSIPLIDEPPRADAEPVAAVGVSDLQNWTGHGRPAGYSYDENGRTPPEWNAAANFLYATLLALW